MWDSSQMASKTDRFVMTFFGHGFHGFTHPIPSMYGIFTYTFTIFLPLKTNPNVGKSTIPMDGIFTAQDLAVRLLCDRLQMDGVAIGLAAWMTRWGQDNTILTNYIFCHGYAYINLWSWSTYIYMCYLLYVLFVVMLCLSFINISYFYVLHINKYIYIDI